MQGTKVQCTLPEKVAKLFDSRCKRFGCMNRAAMVRLCCIVFAELLQGTYDHELAREDEVAALFARMADSQRHPFGNPPKQIRRRAL